jgi:hypothetical protein
MRPSRRGLLIGRPLHWIDAAFPLEASAPERLLQVDRAQASVHVPAVVIRRLDQILRAANQVGKIGRRLIHASGVADRIAHSGLSLRAASVGFVLGFIRRNH